jgi:hypothetical protein
MMGVRNFAVWKLTDIEGPVLLQKAALFNSSLTEDIVFPALFFIVAAMRT